MDEVRNLEGRLAQNDNLMKSAEQLVVWLADQLDGLTHDPVAIKVLADKLRTNAHIIAAAILANTTAPPKLKKRGGKSSGK